MRCGEFEQVNGFVVNNLADHATELQAKVEHLQGINDAMFNVIVKCLKQMTGVATHADIPAECLLIIDDMNAMVKSMMDQK